ncbi:MAG TPA: CHASE2 domain-containing protein [Pseudolabrys sp.]
MHNALQNAITDLRFGWFPRQASGNVVLVAIDSPSLEKIGVWPWPRTLHAELIDRLESAGAADVVFDVDFSSPSNPASDQAFAEALKKAGGSVVLPAFQQLAGNSERRKSVYVSRPLPQFGEQSWSAVVNVAVEPDGLVRRYSYGETLEGAFLPSVGALLAGTYDANAKPFQIDFSIDADSLPTVSYADVLRGDAAALKKIKGHKVVIGATAVELGDRFNVPNKGVIVGPILQILAAESIMQSRALHGSSTTTTLGGLAGLFLLMVALWGRSSAGLRVVVLVGLVVAVELAAVFLQAKLPVIPDTSMLHAAIAAYLAALALDEIDFHQLLEMIAEKRFQRIAMSLGDGLVCADQNGLITVWNRGAAAIFGYEPDEMIGQPLDRICTFGNGNGKFDPISVLASPRGAPQAAGGKVMEIEGRRRTARRFRSRPVSPNGRASTGYNMAPSCAIYRSASAKRKESSISRNTIR